MGPEGSLRPMSAPPSTANLAQNLVATAQRHGDRIALRLDALELSYHMLDGGSAHVAGLLRSKGVKPGDRVGIMLPNVPYFPVVYYGALRAGATIVPMNVLLKGREVTFYLQDPEVEVLFAWHDFADAAEGGAGGAGAEVVLVRPGEFEPLLGAAEPVTEVADRAGDDTAVILYTSGTTGTPKGAELTHENPRRNSEVSRGLFDLSEEDVVLGALPLFHSFGQTCAMNNCVGAGAVLSLSPPSAPR